MAIQCKVCSKWDCFSCDYDKIEEVEPIFKNVKLGVSAYVEPNVVFTNANGSTHMITKSFLDKIFYVQRIDTATGTYTQIGTQSRYFEVVEDLFLVMCLLSWLRNQ